ncbi:MAG TPA: alpha/beta fold hydrolase [Candidatus Choladousia intestinipullorum]|nr:alpha/beta fold hydrolase [Candidatus Choladousia intestinipullorum]
MKKRLLFLMLAGCLAAGSAAFAGFHNLPVYAQEKELDAQKFAETLCTGDVTELENNYTYTEELLTALEPAGGFAGLQASLKQLGALKQTGEPVVSEVSGYTSYSVPCQFEVQNVNLVINVNAKGQIAGIMTAAYAEPARSEELPEGLAELDLGIPVEGEEGWELPGTLTLPDVQGEYPAVVLVHGSGPNDRDETIGPNKVFRDLAWDLAQQGIAVYRYDKRTYVYGQELADDAEITLEEETVEDAKQAVLTLKQHQNIDEEHVYVLGHSLGGEALPMIHKALTDEGESAAGYVFLAAPARKLPDIMREQYDFLYSLMPELTEEQESEKDVIYEELDKLNDLDSLAEDEPVLGAYKKYWEYLDQYDYVEMAGEIEENCLVLQGEEDYQVTMEDFSIWQDAYGDKSNWSFISYPGLTHLFMPGERENGNEDYMTPQTVDPQVTADIAKFVMEEK